MLKALAVAETLLAEGDINVATNRDIQCALFRGEVALTVGALSPGTPLAVIEKSSTAMPSSAPPASTSFQRIQKLEPFPMLNLVIVELKGKCGLLARCRRVLQ